MASPGNQHCVNSIGTLLFPILKQFSVHCVKSVKTLNSLLAAHALHLLSLSVVHPQHLLYNNRSFLPVCFPSSLESTPGPPQSTPH